jgi:hypothetical protein
LPAEQSGFVFNLAGVAASGTSSHIAVTLTIAGSQDNRSREGA